MALVFIMVKGWDYGRIDSWSGLKFPLVPKEGVSWLFYQLAQIGGRRGRNKLQLEISQQSEILKIWSQTLLYYLRS